MGNVIIGPARPDMPRFPTRKGTVIVPPKPSPGTAKNPLDHGVGKSGSYTGGGSVPPRVKKIVFPEN